jgi:hypothetical protein
MSLSGGPQAKATTAFSVPDVTTTALTTSVDPVGTGKPVTYTATVTAANASSGTPVGNVTFKDGASPIGSCNPVVLAGDVATCTVTYPSAGSHLITAFYAGTPSFVPSTSTSLGETATNCASLSGCNLAGANLMNANLQGANLTKAYMKGADLQGANLQGANLTSAYLGNANLSFANLQGARLTSAYLVAADLSGANLKNAVLTSADLHNANLTNADMTGATLTSATLSGVIWSNTVCPDGTNSTAHGNTCIGHL